MKTKLPDQNNLGLGSTVTQLCQHNHPEHKDVAKCPYDLRKPAFRIPPKHVKKPGGPVKLGLSVASQSVMDHAHQELSAGRARVIDKAANKGNDIEVEIDRQHKHKSTSKQTRNFFVHKNPGDGSAHDFFTKLGEAEDSESSESEEEMDEKKEDSK